MKAHTRTHLPQNLLLRFATSCKARPLAGLTPGLFPLGKTLQTANLILLCALVQTARPTSQSHVINLPAESRRTATDSSFYSSSLPVPVVCPCSWWWEWLKAAKGRASSGAQKAHKQSKCKQKRMTVLLGKDCPSSSEFSTKLLAVLCLETMLWVNFRIPSNKEPAEELMKVQERFQSKDHFTCIPYIPSARAVAAKTTGKRAVVEKVSVLPQRSGWGTRKGRRGQALSLKVLPIPPRDTRPLLAASFLQVGKELRWA